MKKRGSALVFLWFITFVAFSCRDGNIIEEQQKKLPQSSWHYDSTAVFTLSPQEDFEADLYVTMRSEENYRNCNLYIISTLLSEKDTVFSERKELILSDCETGEPFGKVTGGFYDFEFKVRENIQLKKSGKYTIAFKQYMREDTLRGMQTIGFMLYKKGAD
jgi:gliding motility-associated lipoprotein GldH